MKTFLCFQHPLSRVAEKQPQGRNPGRIQGMDDPGVQAVAREGWLSQRDRIWPVPAPPPLMVIGTFSLKLPQPWWTFVTLFENCARKVIRPLI